MKDTDPIRLDLLLFTVGGVHFGADTEQIAEIASYCGEQSEDLFWFHSLLDYGEATVTYGEPMVVTLQAGAGAPYRVVIDSMETITECSLQDIQLFSPLLEPFAIRKGLWGILSRNGQMVLLVDFKRLFQGKSTPFATEADREC